MTAYDRIDDKNVLLLAVEIDVAKVVFNEYNLKVSGHLRTVSQDKIKFLFFIKRNRV